MFKRIKRITSHAGHARLLAECGDEPIGFLPTNPSIPSPYRYSPTHVVLDWDGRRIFIVETSHKIYDVFEVPLDAAVYTTDDEATDAFLAAKRD